MSDTPQTDEAIIHWTATPGPVVPAEFARGLERECNELRAKYRMHHEEAERLTRDRNDTIKEAVTLGDMLDMQIKLSSKLAGAARELIFAKGRHNTALAYGKLKDAYNAWKEVHS